MVHPDGLVIRWTWYALIATWVVLALRTKRTVERRSQARVIVVVLLGLAVAGASGSSTGAWHRPLWSVTSTLSVLATSLVVLGAAFAIWARLAIGANWSGTVALKEDHELVVSGPYRVVRHPIYTGLIAMGLGTVIMYPQPVYLAILALSSSIVLARIPVEERLMTETFPDQYPAYRRRVKAVIPFIL
ncbi:MAG: isoprenylcysteine carboxylmethyltransferase family protein [Acidobacteriota bacterium]|nr:isoprenylcysteine carboxylmethyltransferase family protein [Acidobacteriota bacterium]